MHRIALPSALVFLIAGFACHAADEVDPVRVYLDQIRSRDTGIYEIGNWLYANVRVPAKVQGNPRYDAEMKAKSELNRLILKWAAIEAAAKRKDWAERPRGKAFLERICREEAPYWYLGDWQWSSKMRTFPARTIEGEYVFGAALPAQTLRASIPAAAGQVAEDRELYRSAGQLAKERMESNKRDAFLASIGAFDARKNAPVLAIPDARWWTDVKVEDEAQKAFLKLYRETNADDVSDVGKEWSAFNERLLSFFAEDAMFSDWAAEARAIAQTRTNVVERFGRTEVVSHTNVVVSVSTNRSESVETISEHPVELDWSILSEDLPARPAAGIVAGASRENHKEVVLTNIVTTIQTEIRIPILEETSVLAGYPRFEELVLSCAMLPNAQSQRTSLGRNAEKSFYDPKTDLASKTDMLIDALRDNPGDADLWNLFGRCQQVAKRHLAAVICFRNALRIDPNHGFALVNLALSYQELGFEKLAFGTAFAALGATEDEWCRKKAESILSPAEGADKP